MFIFCSVSSFHVKRPFPRPRLLLGEIIRNDEDPDPFYVIGSTTTDNIYIYTLYWLYAYIHRSSIFKSSSVKHIHQSNRGQMWFLLRSADIGPTGGGCPHGRGWSRVKWLSWLLNRCWFYDMINGHRFERIFVSSFLFFPGLVGTTGDVGLQCLMKWFV